jgi:hypothetical protein
VALSSRQLPAWQATYSELKRRAAEQPLVFVGSPGSVDVRTVNGCDFTYRQFYDATGKKTAEYVGPVGDPAAEAKAAELRERIVLANALAKETRALAQQGYVRADVRTVAVLAAVANHGLFRAGAVLVGSHAYEALLNELGVRAAAFATDDVDLARDEPLAFDEPVDLAAILADSTVPLVPVPGLDRKAPTTSYKAPGADRFRVDLLVPARGADVRIARVPELRAHATALPHLRYLLEDPLDSVVLGRSSVVPVRIPRAEAFAWHKMLVSQLRTTTSEKRGKDIQQASVLFAVLAEDAPDALGEAFAALPRGAKVLARAGARQVTRVLETAGAGRARDVMRAIV